MAKLFKKELFAPSHRASQISVGSQNSDTSVPTRNEHTQFILIRVELAAAWSISYRNIIDAVEGIFKPLKVTTGNILSLLESFSFGFFQSCGRNVQFQGGEPCQWDSAALEAFATS